MLPLKTMLYLGLFSLLTIGAILYHPVVGVFAYLATYNINPLGQWWGNYLPTYFERYSLIIATATLIGFFIHHSKLKYRKLLETQEILLLLFLFILWFSTVLGNSSDIDYNIIKMSKVCLFLLVASHTVSTKKHFDLLLWVFILSGLYLGAELFMGSGQMIGGRLQGGVGGSDFSEGNFLAAHFGLLLPFAGVMFLKGKWKTKVLSLISAVFIFNGVILTRSRGIFIALGVGIIFALWNSRRFKKYYKQILVLMIIGAAGVILLTDPGFWGRMQTIQLQESDALDQSSLRRLQAWDCAWQMAQDHPMGIGVGNFFDYVGSYNPSIAGMDTHNTYLRCLAELGFHGLIILMLLILNAFRILKSIKIVVSDSVLENEYNLYILAVQTALIVYLMAGMFISTVYIEEFYWLLMMPVFMKRSLENELEIERSVKENFSFESKMVLS